VFDRREARDVFSVFFLRHGPQPLREPRVRNHKTSTAAAILHSVGDGYDE